MHGAVQKLLTAMDRAEVTVPMIAENAGVTPSTIHRRWGDLADLLADVAVARVRWQPALLPRGRPSMAALHQALVSRIRERNRSVALRCNWSRSFMPVAFIALISRSKSLPRRQGRKFGSLQGECYRADERNAVSASVTLPSLSQVHLRHP